MKEGSSSFLKKRTKKLFTARPSAAAPGWLPSGVEQRAKVFWFFFSKKNCLNLLTRETTPLCAQG
jgi:hypothetical protein